MNAKNKSFALPLTFVGIMFFAIGFALGINSLLVPVLQGSLGISNAASYLIIAATFIPFLIFGYPAGLTIKAIGYKRTMSLSFIIFAVAFYLFILSADYKSFSLFLLASFISGAANAYLQASVNPYITILGPLESAAKRISIMGICNKLAWPIPSIFIVWLLGKDVNLIGIEDLNKPFIIIICAFIALGIMAFFAPLPEVKAEGEDEDDTTSSASSYAAGKTSVFQFPHLLLGCLALFLYVGVETLDCPHRHRHRLHLRHHLHSEIHQPGRRAEGVLHSGCHRLAARRAHAAGHLHLLYLVHGAGLLANVACPMAAGHGRPGQVHQSRFVAAHHGHVRRCRYPHPLRMVEGRDQPPASLLALPAVLPVHPLLWCVGI